MQMLTELFYLENLKTSAMLDAFKHTFSSKVLKKMEPSSREVVAKRPE